MGWIALGMFVAGVLIGFLVDTARKIAAGRPPMGYGEMLVACAIVEIVAFLAGLLVGANVQ